MSFISWFQLLEPTHPVQRSAPRKCNQPDAYIKYERHVFSFFNPFKGVM